MVCFGRKPESDRPLSSCRQLANRLTYLVIAPIDATASVSVAEQSQQFALSNLPLLGLYSLIREDREAEETSVLDSHYLLFLDYLAHYLL